MPAACAAAPQELKHSTYRSTGLAATSISIVMAQMDTTASCHIQQPEDACFSQTLRNNKLRRLTLLVWVSDFPYSSARKCRKNRTRNSQNGCTRPGITPAS